MKKPQWRKHSVLADKRNARRIAKMLREPGAGRVRCRIVKEVYWRVDYDDSGAYISDKQREAI